MGIEYRGMLCVGYTYAQAVELYENHESEDYEDFYEFCEGEGLDSFSPYYDADREDCIFGYEVAASRDYSVSEVIISLDDKIEKLSDELDEKFFKKPSAYIMAHGW